MGHVRIRQGSRRGDNARRRDDARPDGARARDRPEVRARPGECGCRSRGHTGRQRREEGKVVPVGTVLVVIGGEPDGEQPRAETQAAREAVPEPPGNSLLQSTTGPVRATPLVRKIAQELGVDLASVEGTGPQGRITEKDVRTAGGGPEGEGRREPLRGVRRLITEHMARAHREVPPVTWVEECDFSNV